MVIFSRRTRELYSGDTVPRRSRRLVSGLGPGFLSSLSLVGRRGESLGLPVVRTRVAESGRVWEKPCRREMALNRASLVRDFPKVSSRYGRRRRRRRRRRSSRSPVGSDRDGSGRGRGRGYVSRGPRCSPPLTISMLLPPLFVLLWELKR